MAVDSRTLRREVGLGGAVLIGLGSMVGTGAFISLAIAAGASGDFLLLAVLIAGALALANALSSAQLAAAHPVSGGTYEYGYRFLTPTMGFAAGALFMVAKSASAATAALGASTYLLDAVGITEVAPRIALAVLLCASVTILAAGGLRQSNRGNLLVVSITFAGLIALVIAGLSTSDNGGWTSISGHFAFPRPIAQDLSPLFTASALLFVAFTGYGRIATLGEEVREPKLVIPKAVVTTIATVITLYFALSWVALERVGPVAFAASAEGSTAPLQVVARAIEIPGLEVLVGVSAVTAMLGVFLNLILGLSRVLLAMARRGDAPMIFSSIDVAKNSPRYAVIGCGVCVACLCLIGDVRTTWSLSAFTVLVYYAITNLAALKLAAPLRRYPRWIPGVGLVGCVLLAAWVDTSMLWIGSIALLTSLTVRWVVRSVVR